MISYWVFLGFDAGKLNWNVSEAKHDPYCKDVFMVVDDFCSQAEMDLVPIGFDDFFAVLLEGFYWGKNLRGCGAWFRTWIWDFCG
jgi:hypothetical protein